VTGILFKISWPDLAGAGVICSRVQWVVTEYKRAHDAADLVAAEDGCVGSHVETVKQLDALASSVRALIRPVSVERSLRDR
jgi:hypothetical protein